MENNEEYLLRTLRRTTSGLTDSLIPAHGAKLTKLLNRFENADVVTGEVQTLLRVQGFGKCALAMEWLLERTKTTGTDVSPEQFESDILLLNEKLFEAFLNQPFDMPDYSRSFEAPVRPVQHIQVSDEEFMGTSYPALTPAQLSTAADDEQTGTPSPDPFTDPAWGAASAESADPFAAMVSAAADEVSAGTVTDEHSSSVELQDPFAPQSLNTADPFNTSATVTDRSEETSGPLSDLSDPFGGSLLAQLEAEEREKEHAAAGDKSPSLRESMSQDLFEATERAAQTAAEFLDKSTGERPIAMAVFRVSVRAAAESARSASNLVAQDLFDAILKLIAYADEQGKIKSEPFALAIRDIGDRLTIALSAEHGGITLLKNLTNYLQSPKDLLTAK